MRLAISAPWSKRRGEPDQSRLLGRQAECFGEPAGELTNAACVCAGVVVAILRLRRQPGERLELRLVESLGCQVGLGHVLDLRVQLEDVPGLVADRGHRDAHVEDVTVAVQVALLDVVAVCR